MQSNDVYAMDAGAALRGSGSLRRDRVLRALAAACALVMANFGVDAEAQAPSQGISIQSLVGPNVMIFDPSMPTSQIQATVDTIANQQLSNQFGAQRYALLFKPGTMDPPPSRSPSRWATTPA